MNLIGRYLRRPQPLAFRRFTFQVHLWAGIALTAYLVVIGITGSVLVFRPELERLCGLKPWPVAQSSEPAADIASVVRNLKAAYPGGRIISVEAPTKDDSTFVAEVQRGARIKVACAATGAVLGEFPRSRNWLDDIAELHESLFLHQTGRVLNGVGGATLLLLNVTGLVIWWPGIRNWRRALKVDFGRSWRRINFDLHSAVGFWTILIASFWAVSGIYFAWPRQVFRFVNSFSPIISARPPAIRVEAEGSEPDPDLGALVHRARTMDGGAAFGGVVFPYSRRAPLGIHMRRKSAPGYEYVDTVYFNPYSSEYISTWRYGVNQSVGDWIIWLQTPLHFGTYWGAGVKVVWAGAGLAIPLLAVTGLLMYWNRALRRKWKRLRRPAPAPMAA